MAATDYEHKIASPVKLFGFNITSTKQNDTAFEPSNDNNNHNQIIQQKYECQYCCREFANSQALGGHQNAHKKERQLLKRAQLVQSAAATSAQPHPLMVPHLLGPQAHHNSWFYSTPYHYYSPHPGTLRHVAAVRGGGGFDVDNIAAFRASYSSERRDRGDMNNVHKGLALDLQLGLGPN